MRMLPLLALGPVLAGCTVTDAAYPSLLPRPIESVSDAEPVRPDPVVAPDATLDSRIAAHRADADAAAEAFRSQAITAEAKVAVARGVAAGSESWIAAQSALADLGATRARTVEIVTALEEIAIARAQAGEPSYPALDAAIAEIGKRASDQAARVAALDTALAG
ncbi:hypothetical protein [Sphingomonas sp.]|uniref:hypothetical protein n=1 Tax=Sphingomonas sp. TaxID=28214 RepID=UPI001EBCE849|nr:hypothetical protein [Sphingomonas sp.]MBX3593849.1 hypothetical protein [Sphingomonas sp.]